MAILVICLCLTTPVRADTPTAASPTRASEPTVVEIGTYILRIADVSEKDGSFNVDMWVWLRWKGDTIQPQKSFEVANGLISNRLETEILDDLGYHYTTVRVQATIFHEFDVKHFPLDDHILNIELEDSTYDAATIRY